MTSLDKMHEILSLVGKFRFPLSSETRLQESLEKQFIAGGLEFKREHRFSPEDRVDFFETTAGIAIEVKIKSGPSALYRQMERYSKHDVVNQLLLITNVQTAFPAELSGKPVFILNLARAWL